jgi:hypothetical protein
VGREVTDAAQCGQVQDDVFKDTANAAGPPSALICAMGALF